MHRYRKKPQQIDVLWNVFRQNKGKMPSRKERMQMAEALQMRENQVYKWFWEVKHKQQDMCVLVLLKVVITLQMS